MRATPGPWKAHNSNTYDYIDIDAAGTRICSIPLDTCGINYDPWDKNDTPENEVAARRANSRLIAAAPDLLKAVEMVLDADGDLYAICFDQLRVAVAKAKGETI